MCVKIILLNSSMWMFIIILLCVNRSYARIEYEETEDISLQIVGIFGTNSDAGVQRAVFEKNVNGYKLNSEQVTYNLEARILDTPRSDSFSTWQTFCKEALEKEITPIAVFGPQDPIADGAIRDECALTQIPHLQATWQPPDPERRALLEEGTEEKIEEDGLEESANEEEETQEETETKLRSLTINYYPHADDLSIAYARLLKYYNWDSFSVLYEDDFGLMRVQKILSEHTTTFPVTVHRVEPGGDNKHVFKKMAEHRESRILLDCSIDNVLQYMNEALPLNMVNHYQHYILTSIDGSSINNQLETFRSNISWLSITNFDELANPQNNLAPTAWRWTGDQTGAALPALNSFKVEPFLMADMAHHVLTAARNLSEQLKDETPPTPCKSDQPPWSLGPAMLESLLKTQTRGDSGIIAFDQFGRRINYRLYVNQIYVQNRDTVGWWDHGTEGDVIPETNEATKLSVQHKSKHFNIISRLAKPYFAKKENFTGDIDDPSQYEGFAVDLVDAIFEVLGTMGYDYTYSFVGNLITEGKSYGTFIPEQKKWNGLIGDLLDKKADLAVCDLTITEERKNVVDFSVPFMNLGISILFKKEHEIEPDTFSFLHPYSFHVWISTATAYMVVSIVLYVCSRISPADWENPQPCDKEPEELENIWNFKNCTWLTMGSIMTQGCDILPKAVGSRWVCSMWWFFALIVCQTYIAQLAASLTSAMENEPINGVEDLAKQNKINYGLIYGGSTYAFFKNSKDKMYQRMYETMESKPGVYTSDNDAGADMVLNGHNRYAFFMESSTIEYKLRRNCELTQVGNLLDSKDYGIAMPANSPFRSQINLAILTLKENTKLEDIRKQWWEQKYDALECKVEEDKGNVEGDLEMKNLIGAFLVLIVGLAFCLFITAAEFMNEVRNIVVRERVTHKEAFVQELKASLNFSQLQKPVLKNPSRAPSLNSRERTASRAGSIASFINLEKIAG